MKADDSQIFVRNQRVLFHLFALLFVEMVTKLMLDLMAKDEYKPFRKVLVPLFVLHYIVAMNENSEDAMEWIRNWTDEDTDLYIRVYTAFLFVYLAVLIKIVIGEVCDLLGIW